MLQPIEEDEKKEEHEPDHDGLQPRSLRESICGDQRQRRASLTSILMAVVVGWTVSE